MENPKCAECSTFPDDLLMMNCAHDLCLQCAALLLTPSLTNKSAYNDTLACSLCRQQTRLEPESIIELAKLLPTKKYPQFVLSNSQNQIPDFNSSRNSLSTPLDSASHTLCHQHPQQVINYFCFDCKCPCICAQCIIHGVHKEHDVKIVRKAFYIIKQQIDKHLNQTEKLCIFLQGKKIELQNKLKHCSDESQRLKKEIKSVFRNFRDKLALAEAQAVFKCQQQMKEHRQQITKQYMSFASRISQLKERQTNVRKLYEKSQVKLINYYAQNIVSLERQQESDFDISILKTPQLPRILISRLQNMVNSFSYALSEEENKK